MDVAESDLYEAMVRIEDGLRRVEEHDLFRVFSWGIRAYADSIEKGSSESEKNFLLLSISERIRSAPDLSSPHRKILDVLLQKYELERGDFGEVHFSKLVQEARVSKSKAKEYLHILEQGGYIERREDGYRKFFRIKRQ